MVRIGISFGEADSHENDYFGVPVVEAARLCAIAEGGQILATELASLLAGSRAGLDLVPIGPKSLKGLPEPVAAREVKWSPLVEERDVAIPLPTRLAAPANVFVGRSDGTRAPDRRLQGRAGRRTAIDADRRRARDREDGVGATVRRGGARRRCDRAVRTERRGDCPPLPSLDRSAHAPRHAFADRGDRGARHHPRSPPRSARSGAAPTNAGSRRGPGARTRGRALPRVRFSCRPPRRASSLAPIVIVLDDLHWVDKPSLQLLRHVVASADSLRLLVVGTFRSDVGLDHPLSEALVALHREPRVDRFSLRGLDDNDLLSLMESIAGHEMGRHGPGSP